MPYHLSATKLQTYHRCPQSYYWRYEYGIKSPAAFRSAVLGTALHQTLAAIYRDWHYLEPLPNLDWVNHCWQQCASQLNLNQFEEGWEILVHYYNQRIASQNVLVRPIAVEGRIQGVLQAEGIEFALSGRYDRLDVDDDGLHLVDYKSSKEVQPDSETIDLQLGVYFIALEQRYKQLLKSLSLIYLRTGNEIIYHVTAEHKQCVQELIKDLALQLRADENWVPKPGQQCEHCSYRKYCPAVERKPEPLPEPTKQPERIQLTLNL